MALSESVLRLLKQRYLQPDETWTDLVNRVIEHVYADDPNTDEKEAARFLLQEGIFILNSPALVNSGTRVNGLFACFTVGPREDSLEAHMDTLKDIAEVGKSGGGCGFTGTFIRPEGSPVAGSAHGYAYGPNAFAITVNNTLDMITQGGFRKMALMYTMRTDHPDLEKFIDLKQSGDETHAARFNQSIMATDEWMDNAIKDGTEENRLLQKIAFNIWNNGEPGFLFRDEINRNTPYALCGCNIEVTNPSLARGTRVLTSQGIFEIQELEGKGNLFVSNLYGVDSYAKCIKTGNNERLFEVSLKGGTVYHATKQHKWVVLNKTTGKYFKKTTGELNAGDLLPKTPERNSLGFGDKGTYDDGFLVGWNLGDGSITVRRDTGKKQFGFVTNNQEKNIRELIAEHISSITGNVHNWSRRQRDGEPWYELASSNKKLAKFFNSFQTGKKETGLPKLIWNDTSDDFRSGLIDGLFSSDGFVKKDGTGMVFTSSYERLAIDVKELLGFHGIKSSIHMQVQDGVFPNGVDYDKKYTTYRVKLGKYATLQFSRLWKLTSLNKQERLNRAEPLRKNSVIHTHVQVKSIKDTRRNDEVWDLQVFDDTHSFCLPSVATGNCGEQPLPDYGSCNLGSVNLAHPYLLEADNYMARLRSIIMIATRFLDNVGSRNRFPNDKFKTWYEEHRPIGIGVMGLADLFLEREIVYSSEESIDLTETIFRQMYHTSNYTSQQLGVERGIPSHCEQHNRRNATLLTVAPTGSISFLAECSSGIEPIFSPSYTRTDERGEKYTFTHKLADETYFRSTINDDNSKLPLAKEHVEIQAACQRHVDSGISKTINLPNETTVEQVYAILVDAYKRGGLKGLTMYRSGSRQVEVLVDNKAKSKTQIDGWVKRPAVLQGRAFYDRPSKMTVLVGTRDDVPYELFAIKMEVDGSNIKSGIAGTIEKIGSGEYDFVSDGGYADVLDMTQYETSEQAQITRQVSLALRHGVKPGYIVDGLEKSGGLVNSYVNGIARQLKRFAEDTAAKCPECHAHLTRQEGCLTCVDCGFSKCS